VFGRKEKARGIIVLCGRSLIIVLSIVRKLVQSGRLKALEILIRAPEPHAGQQFGAAVTISQSRHRLAWLRGTKFRFVGFIISVPLQVSRSLWARGAGSAQISRFQKSFAARFQIRLTVGSKRSGRLDISRTWSPLYTIVGTAWWRLGGFGESSSGSSVKLAMARLQQPARHWQVGAYYQHFTWQSL